jgi:hypothetical protein
MQGNEIHTPFLKEFLKKAGIEEGMGRPEARSRLFEMGEELTFWGYEQIARLAQQHGAVPAMVFLPNTARVFEREELEFLNRIADELGYVVIDLEGVYDAHDLEAIRIAPWDLHPNAKGHRLIADRLYEALLQNGPLLRTEKPAQSTGPMTIVHRQTATPDD